MADDAQPSADPNPVVFVDVAIADAPAGRIHIELFRHVAPRTADNFRQLATGECTRDGKPIGYKHAPFHRVMKGFMCQGGDFVNADGTGCTSIYGNTFDDETFALSHDAPGLLSMANSGPNTNGCQFFITCDACPWLDGKHVVFGRVIDGMLTVRKMEAVSVGANSKPTLPILITECGEM